MEHAECNDSLILTWIRLSCICYYKLKKIYFYDEHALEKEDSNINMFKMNEKLYIIL